MKGRRPIPAAPEGRTRCSTRRSLAAERTLTKPRTIGGWDLPADIRVYPAITVVHLREDLYRQPNEFRPDRFIEEDAPSYAWLPCRSAAASAAASAPRSRRPRWQR